MIIHSPIISGSLTFANGATFTLPDTGVFSGSFSGSVTGLGDPATFSASLDSKIQKLTIDTGSQDARLDLIESYTSSLETKNSTLATYTASVDTQLSNLNSATSSYETKGRGLVSGSSQITYASVSSIPAGIVSGSSQVTPLLPTGVISGSAQLTATLPIGVVSGSSQVNADSVTNFDENVLAYNNSLAVVSGSASNVKTFLSLGNVTNESKATMFSSPTFTGTVSGVTATHVGLGNVTNESKATMFASPTFTGTVSGVTATHVSLGNVTNESKATMFTSPEFTGTPLAPTAAANTNSTQIATTAYVQTELTDLIGGANAAFDTLLEISASLASGDSTLNTLVGGKLSKASNLSDLTDTGTARTNLGVAIGTNVQAYNSTLAAVAGGTYSGDDSITTLGTITAGTWNGTAIANANLANSTISGKALGTNLDTLTIGTGLSGTSYNGSAAITIANTGVTSNVAGSGISVSGATGAVTITNSGVRSIAAGTGVAVSATTGDSCSISIGQSVATSASPTFAGLTINGAITATGDITAFSASDIRFKENITAIENPIEKIKMISGNTYDWKAENKDIHGFEGNDVGVIAQEIEEVLPQLVVTRDNGYKAVKYDKLVALLIEGMKEQQKQIEDLSNKINKLENEL